MDVDRHAAVIAIHRASSQDKIGVTEVKDATTTWATGDVSLIRARAEGLADPDSDHDISSRVGDFRTETYSAKRSPAR